MSHFANSIGARKLLDRWIVDSPPTHALLSTGQRMNGHPCIEEMLSRGIPMRNDDMRSYKVSFCTKCVEKVSKHNVAPKIYPTLIRSEVRKSLAQFLSRNSPHQRCPPRRRLRRQHNLLNFNVRSPFFQAAILPFLRLHFDRFPRCTGCEGACGNKSVNSDTGNVQQAAISTGVTAITERFALTTTTRLIVHERRRGD